MPHHALGRQLELCRQGWPSSVREITFWGRERGLKGTKGFSGLSMGIELKKRGVEDFTIFESEAKLGGVY
eukprot:1392044-Amorphochlora_amoeboformis.AAC.1